MPCQQLPKRYQLQYLDKYVKLGFQIFNAAEQFSSHLSR